MSITILDKDDKYIQLVTPYVLRKLSKRFKVALHMKTKQGTVMKVTDAVRDDVDKAIDEVENDKKT